LKPSNILINARGEAMIGDFGAARATWEDRTLTQDAGTINYAAPELFDENQCTTSKVDVYSFGLVLFEILTGEAVFPFDMYPFQVIRRLIAGQFPVVPETCGNLMQELIQWCWARNPEDRPSFSDSVSDFQSADFMIVPGADRRLVGDYIRGILTWEVSGSG
jgi:serine/threonine protein kinase